MTLGNASVAEAKAHDEAFLRCFASAASALRFCDVKEGQMEWEDDQREYSEKLLAAQSEVRAHLANSVDTPSCLRALSNLAKATTAYAEQCSGFKGLLLERSPRSSESLNSSD